MRLSEHGGLEGSRWGPAGQAWGQTPPVRLQRSSVLVALANCTWEARLVFLQGPLGCAQWWAVGGPRWGMGTCPPAMPLPWRLELQAPAGPTGARQR